MPLNITRASDPIEAKTATVLVYGQPGIGKTSLGFTADEPLLLDFDNGARRSHFRRDSVQIQSWADVKGMTADDLAAYSTLVVDTVGRLLDVLAADLINSDAKMATRAGALTLQGYGALKAEFAAWVNRVRGFGLDVVLIAHDKEDKDGDRRVIRPDIQGGSYGEAFKLADGVAYMFRDGKGTVLDFSPTDAYVGKNAGGFDPMVVPDFRDQPGFMGDVISQIKDALNALSVEGERIAQELAEFTTKVENADQPDELTGLARECRKADDPGAEKVMVKLVMDRAKALNFTWEGGKVKGGFVAPEREPGCDDDKGEAA